MRCARCKKNAVFLRPACCKEHFISYFEDKVKKTIKRFGLFKKEEKVAVAVSGGKDSMSLLFLLHRLGYRVSAIAIDEGISGYRDKTLGTAMDFCKKEGINFKRYSFESEFGMPLEDIVKKNKIRPCTVCGVFRRYLLNKFTRGYDAIATGHNLDDEAQAVVMNLLKGNTAMLLRQGPVSGNEKSKMFVKRVKPFYLCHEKEVMAYAFLNNLVPDFNECPYVERSFRHKINNMLNKISLKNPKIKESVVFWFLKTAYKKGTTWKKIGACCICKEASSSPVCSSCRTIEAIKTNIK